jgi:hypothetical protein
MKKNILLYLKDATVTGRKKAAAALRKKGITVLAQYGNTALEVLVTDKESTWIQSTSHFSESFEGAISATVLKRMDTEGKQIAKVWNERQDSAPSVEGIAGAGAEKSNRGLSWGTKGFDEPRPHTDISGSFFLKTLQEKRANDSALPTTKRKGFSPARSKKSYATIYAQLLTKLKDPTKVYHLARLAIIRPDLEATILAMPKSEVNELFEASRTDRANLGFAPEAAAAAAPEAACWRLDGEISVGVVFVESSKTGGPTFSSADRITLLSEVETGLNWLASQHPLGKVTWVYNFQYVKIDVADGTNNSTEDYWRNPAMQKVSYNGKTFASNWSGVVNYRNEMRTVNNSAHAIVVFVTPFGTDWHAYASSGRLTLANRNNWGGWGIGTIDAITAHEVCHLFGAADEYTGNGTPCNSCSTVHGCLSFPNGNCKACAASPVPCIMDANSLQICGYTRGQLSWPAVWDWLRIDNGTGTKALAASGTKLYKLKNNGEIWAYSGTAQNWQKIDNNPATIAIAAAGNNLYQLHNNGKIWKYTGVPLSGWQCLDANTATKAIAAAGNNLYQLHASGKIWKYTGIPLSGWECIDTNPATTAILAAGSNLYQMHNNGKIWKYTGVPVSGWQCLDTNAATKAIAAAGNNLYQLHNNGTIWKYTGVPISGWQMVDNNALTIGIAAAGNRLLQIHSTGHIWQYTGVPLTGWQMLDFNSASKSITLADNVLYQLHGTGKIWQFTGTLV